MKKYLLASSAITLLPLLTHAQFQINDATDVVSTVDYFINAGVWLLVSLAVIFIVWNAVQFIRNAGGEDRKTYQNAIMWGIVGLAVILSIWGLVNIVRNTFWTNDTMGSYDAQHSVSNLILENPNVGKPVKIQSQSLTPASNSTNKNSSLQDFINSGAGNGD